MSGGKDPSVLFYVQHLLGSGHLRRAALLARTMAASGLDVTLVSGGMSLPHLDYGRAHFEQLPPVRAADASFSALLDEHGAAIDETFKQSRTRALLDLYNHLRPDVVLFEMFPFGRRQMRFELMPLLAAARSASPQPLIVSSVRDVLVTKKNPARLEEMASLVEQAFDAVLVHGDPEIIRFEQTFPHADRIADKLHYTGYVAEPAGETIEPAARTGVVVSAGGGPVGLSLLNTALAARPLTRLAQAPWRLLVSHTIDEEKFASLKNQESQGVIVERSRPDFRALLAASKLSISQAGYNSVLDVLGAGTRSVLVPFADESETEQLVRAQALADCGLCHVVGPETLNASTLAQAIENALDRPAPKAGAICRTGAASSARLLTQMIQDRGRVVPS